MAARLRGFAQQIQPGLNFLAGSLGVFEQEPPLGREQYLLWRSANSRTPIRSSGSRTCMLTAEGDRPDSSAAFRKLVLGCEQNGMEKLEIDVR
ncbi:hypothetical protein QY048_00020 [Bradyrhizobium sp. WYCCWR 12677]|nr:MULTISPECIES: hypothetical protein [unclassified Bradyrhizobium]MDN4999263.1 hypothetical protein [Bradyrhizobium sp. WYCCWR 12677]